MYPNSKTENNYVGMTESSEPMTYESQISRLHELAERLSHKIRHISSSSLVDNFEKNPSHSTPLNRELESVIEHFTTVIDSIIN